MPFKKFLMLSGSSRSQARILNPFFNEVTYQTNSNFHAVSKGNYIYVHIKENWFLNTDINLR